MCINICADINTHIYAILRGFKLFLPWELRGKHKTQKSLYWQSYLVHHYNDVIMSLMVSQSTSLRIVYSTVYWGADQRKHQSSPSLAFVGGTHRWLVVPRPKASNAENVSIWWRHHALRQNNGRVFFSDTKFNVIPSPNLNDESGCKKYMEVVIFWQNILTFCINPLCTWI